MDSAREVVARAIRPGMHEDTATAAFAQAALSALAAAGWVVVPRVLLEDTTRATDNLYRYHFTDRGSYDGKSERDAVLEAGRKIKALLAAAGAKEGA